MKILRALQLSWVAWVWKHTPNCAEMARLSSERLDHPLPWGVRARMWLHFLICVWCHRYLKQLEFLHQHGHQACEHHPEFAHRGLSAEAKKRILLFLAKRHAGEALPEA